MSPPLPPVQQGQLTLIDCLGCLSIVGGAAGGGVLGFKWFGIVGAVAGVPVGAVLGWVVFFALPLLALGGVLALGIWIGCGRTEARRFLWGRGEPPDATSPGG